MLGAETTWWGGWIGEAAALGTAVCWTWTSICFSEAGQRIGSSNVNRLRLLMAGVFLGITVLVTGGVLPWNIPPILLCWLALSGILGLHLGDAALFHSFVLLGPRLSTLVAALWPAMAAVMGWMFLSESMSWLAIVGIVITTTSVSWVAFERAPERPTANSRPEPSGRIKMLGLLCALGGALGQASGFVLGKIGMEVDPITKSAVVSPLDATFARSVVAIITLWGASMITGRARSTIQAARDNPIATRWLTAGAFIGPFIGVWLSLVAGKFGQVGPVATIMATAPIWVIPAMYFLRKEKPTWRAVVGAILAVCGIGLLVYSKAA